MEVSTKRWICSDICRRCSDACRFAGYVGEDEEEMDVQYTDAPCGCRNNDDTRTGDGCCWRNRCSNCANTGCNWRNRCNNCANTGCGCWNGGARANSGCCQNERSAYANTDCGCQNGCCGCF